MTRTFISAFPPVVALGSSTSNPVHFAAAGGIFFHVSIRIMTAVWDRSKQTGGNLLLLLALADSADDNGECWPGVETLARKARMTPRHVRRVLAQLEEHGEVSRLPNAGMKGTNRYLIAPPPPPDILSSPDNPSADPLTFEVRTPDAGVSRTVKNHQEPSRVVKEDDLTIEATRFVEWFQQLLTETGVAKLVLTKPILEGWADAYEKMIRLDGRTKEEIVKVCRWARRDRFWAANFLSPAKLREKNKQQMRYFDVFFHRMTHEESRPIQASGRGRALGDNSNLDALAEYERQQRVASGAGGV
jgi:hypothetical protein